MDPNKPAQPQIPPMRPMNQPHIPISEHEMNPNLHQGSSSSGTKNTLLTLASFVILAGIIIATLWLYIQNNSADKKIAVNPNTNTEKTAPTDTTKNPDQIVVEKKQQENLKKYGVVCRRFTSLDEALQTPEIACVLDLSGQELKEIPEGIYDLPELNELDLSNNNLLSFPEKVLNIPTLINLNLSDNNISSIPSSTTIPNNIQNLQLDGNSLSAEEITKHEVNPK